MKTFGATMKTFGATISIGLGDAIYIASAVNKVKHLYDNIYINASKELADRYKNNTLYNDFYIEFIRTLFTDPKIIIQSEKKFPYIPTETLMNGYFSPTVPRFIKELTDQKYTTEKEEYIVITTKVRQLKYEVYFNIKNNLINKLKNLSKKYKIVIIGEKEVEMNTEYQAYGSNYIYSIYNDLLLLENIVDCTIPKLGITAPELETIKKDCTIMNKARSVITLGCGGNLALALSVANNLNSFRTDNYVFIDKMLINNQQLYTTKDPNLFMKKLEEL